MAFGSRCNIRYQWSTKACAWTGMCLNCGYRVDLLVEDKLIIELKSVEQIKGIHEVQLLTYMRLAGVKIGLLINFNVTNLKSGIKRFVL